MAFELLRTDYVDATFEGLRRYLMSENGDGSVSFHDVTNYTMQEKSFFGAKDANTINTAVNAILAALENGTDLYEVFTQFFELQKTLFLEESDAKQGDFADYIAQLIEYMDQKWDELKAEYTGDIQYFKDVQENAFNVWFQMVRDQLTNDVAGHLQLQIGDLNKLETDVKDDLVSAVNSITLSYDETMTVLGGLKTLKVIISADDGASVEGQTVTLHNEMTGEDTVMQYSGNDGITITVYGDIAYTITLGEMEEHTRPDPRKIVISEGNVMELDLEYKLKPLNELSWDYIDSLSKNGKAGAVLSLHDTKEIELTTGEKVVMEIVGFDHDTLASDGSKTAGITFGMKNCLAQSYRMNTTSTNVGGWKDSEMRTMHVREAFYNVLPEDLKAVIKSVNKKTSAGNRSTTIETTTDDVWLFSLTELGITGLGTPYSQEGSAYPVFISNAARQKTALGATRNYFTRSPHTGNTSQFRYITTSGSNSYANAGATGYYMAAGFCV